MTLLCRKALEYRCFLKSNSKLEMVLLFADLLDRFCVQKKNMFDCRLFTDQSSLRGQATSYFERHPTEL